MSRDETVIVPVPDSQSFSPLGQGLPIPQRSDRGDILDKIKPDLVVEVIRHRLLGEEFLDGKWTSVPALKDKKLTEVGAWEISNLMMGVSSIATSISKLKDPEIKQRVLSLTKTAQYMLLSNWIEYGIRNVAQMHFVHEVIFTNALVVLKQADEASIQELLKGTVQENRNYTSTTRDRGASRVKRVLGMDR